MLEYYYPLLLNIIANMSSSPSPMPTASSAYNIEQYLQLQKKGHTELTRDQRLDLLVLAYYSGKSLRQVVKDFSLGVSHVTLSRLKKQFELWGSLSKAERWGRKPLYDAATMAWLEQWITKNSVYRRMSYQAIKYLGKFPGSVRRIRQACSALGFQKCIPRQKQLITERQRQIRYLWGLDHLKYKRED